MRYAACSYQGGRPANEDSLEHRQLETERSITALADGLGGHGGGKQASQTAVSAICSGWDGRAEPEELKRLVETAHRRVQALQTRACAMKTTVVTLAVHGEQAAWAYAGDSRLYHFHNGTLRYQTTDHSASQIAVMLGQITPAEIRFHEDRGRVLRALGQEGDLKVSTGETALDKGCHVFLLCSDGFWEYVTETEMVLLLQASGGPEEWLEAMCRRIHSVAPEDHDNHSAAVVWLER